MPAVTLSRYFLCCACSKSSPDVADVLDLEALLERRRLGVRWLREVDREREAIVCEGVEYRESTWTCLFFLLYRVGKLSCAR